MLSLQKKEKWSLCFFRRCAFLQPRRGLFGRIATPFPASHLPSVYYGRTGVIVQIRNEEEEKEEEKMGGDESLGSKPVEDFTSLSREKPKDLYKIVHCPLFYFYSTTIQIHSINQISSALPIICLIFILHHSYSAQANYLESHRPHGSLKS